MANALVLSGVDVTVFSFSNASEVALYKSVKLEYETSNKFLRKFIPAIKFSLIDKSQFDILHFHGDDYLVFRRNGTIRTFYGSAIDEALHAKTCTRFFYQAIFYLFEIVSTLLRKKKVGISNATKRKIPFVNRVIPCGVPTETFFRRYGKSEYPSILFIGNFKSRKRGELVLKLFKDKIIKEYPNAHLNIVGSVKNLNDPNITIHENISNDELISLYSKSWVTLVVSSYEGFGVPIIEAMACESVVISTKNAATDEIITDNVTGIISVENKIFENISKIFCNKSYSNGITNRALIYVRENFDMKFVSDKYLQEYKELNAH